MPWNWISSKLFFPYSFRKTLTNLFPSKSASSTYKESSFVIGYKSIFKKKEKTLGRKTNQCSVPQKVLSPTRDSTCLLHSLAPPQPPITIKFTLTLTCFKRVPQNSLNLSTLLKLLTPNRIYLIILSALQIQISTVLKTNPSIKRILFLSSPNKFNQLQLFSLKQSQNL